MMDMPITIEIVDCSTSKQIIDRVFSYFQYIDQKFSTYNKNSEITQINEGKIEKNKYSDDMKTIFRLADETKKISDGFFDIYHNHIYDPSGLVKGWAILNAAKIIKRYGYSNYYVNAGGDIQVSGKNSKNQTWTVGIQNPFNLTQNVKTIYLNNEGIATSGTYIRGLHIYNPKTGNPINSILSLTVIGPNIYEADKIATAAFAMEKAGINFIEKLSGFEGYLIDNNGIATYTSNFNKYTIPI
jgi:FAD:protein FMN transferase